MNKDQTTKTDKSEPELSKKSVLDSKKSNLSTPRKYNKDLQSKRKEHRAVI